MLQLLDAIYTADEETTDSFSEVLRRVLELQPSYSSDSSTPEMQLRARLIKQDGPRALQPLLSDIQGLSFEPDVEAGDGTSRKARVPFILVRDRQHFRRPPLRWYVAYIFAADGSAVYLSLTLGSPPQEDGKKRGSPGIPSSVCLLGAIDPAIGQR